MKLTKFQLLTAFANRCPITIGETSFSFISMIEHENGSTHSFNVKGVGRRIYEPLENGNRFITINVQTID